MEQVLSQKRSLLLSTASSIAVVLVVALAYFALCMANPALAKSSAAGMLIGKTIRFATALKALVLLNPFVAVGNSLGSAMFAISQGDTIQPFVTQLHLLVGLGVWSISKAWGRSRIKDIVLLAGYGLVNGIIVAAKLAGVAMLLHASTWSKILTEAALWKVCVSALTLMAGYGLVLTYEKVMKRGEDRPAE